MRNKCIAFSMKTNTKLRSYRISNELFQKLEQLKKYSIIESKFVRIAIEEKLLHGLPKLKIDKEKIKLPF